jgi:hypothetical protein
MLLLDPYPRFVNYVSHAPLWNKAQEKCHMWAMILTANLVDISIFNINIINILLFC